MYIRILGIAALAACTSTPASVDSTPVSKDEIAAIGPADNGVDYCERYGWYDDGACDDFCVLPDPDCGDAQAARCRTAPPAGSAELAGCCLLGPYDYCTERALVSQDGEGPSLCVGIRGNGERITSHFASLARIYEHYGLFDGVAGGSSASISTFMIESVQMNTHVRCAGCTPHEQGARAAVLLKSLHGYFGVLAGSDEGQALQTLVALSSGVQAEGIGALLQSDPLAGVAALEELLQSPELIGLVNPEVLALLQDSPDPAFHAQDIVDSLQNAANFNAEDPSIFVRPGVIDFRTLARRFGRIASFYAGYAPTDDAGMENFLNECGSTRGLAWRDIVTLPTSDGRTCGALFDELAADYRDNLLADEGAYRSRADDRVGDTLPVLVTTGVIQGAAADTWRAAREAYLSGQSSFPWDINFDDVGFGYFGAAADLARVEANVHGYDDLRTMKRVSLGAPTWAEVLSLSPAEPGLARALELPGGDARVSVGGWSDLQPVLALRNMGCDKVIYLTRRGGPSGFAMGITQLLGIDEAQNAALVDLGGNSSFRRALEEAAGVWCTDWDTPSPTDVEAMYNDGYDAPFETRDAWFAAADGYDVIDSDLGLPGCSPGVLPR